VKSIKKRYIQPIFWAAIGVFLLNSCGSSPTPLQEVTVLPPTLNPNELERTLVPPSTTPFPTQTMTPSPQPRKNYDAACFDHEHASQTQFDHSCEKSNGILMAHDLSWGAFGFRNNSGVMLVTNNQGVEWTLDPVDFMEKEGKYMGPYLVPEAWSKDNRNLYFSASITWDGGGVCWWDFGPAAVYKMEVNTGKIEKILSENDDFLDYWGNLSISPNGEYMIYNDHDQTIFTDLDNGKKKSIQHNENVNLGNFIWSQSGDKLVYVACTFNEENHLASGSEVYVYYTDTGETKKIFSEDRAEIDLVSTTVEEALEMTIHKDSRINWKKYFYLYNFTDQSMVTVTPDLSNRP
jgi:hypothetical protein